MARNIEIKAALSDIALIYERLRQTAAHGPEVLMQKDIFYRMPFGRLKLRQINLLNSEIIYYFRKNDEGPKLSKYYRFKLKKPKLAHFYLSFLFGLQGVVEKKREVFFIERTRIHIDNVLSLGYFIELEVVLSPSESTLHGEKIANDLLSFFDIQEHFLIDKSYLEMLK